MVEDVCPRGRSHCSASSGPSGFRIPTRCKNAPGQQSKKQMLEYMFLLVEFDGTVLSSMSCDEGLRIDPIKQQEQSECTDEPGRKYDQVGIPTTTQYWD